MKAFAKKSENRIQIIDGLRGLSILLMVCYHFGYDLVSFVGAPEGLIFNPLLNVLQPFFAGVFVLLSGISCNFSKNNLKRGAQILVAGFAVTAVTALFDVLSGTVGNAVWFGILSMLGVSGILYALLKPALNRVNSSVKFALYAGLAVCSLFFTGRVYGVKWLFWLGLVGEDFFSADFFPLLPWFFVYMIGTEAGKYVVDRKLPAWFYTAKAPFFAGVGRNTLLIYLLHQPVLYLLTVLIVQIMK